MAGFWLKPRSPSVALVSGSHCVNYYQCKRVPTPNELSTHSYHFCDFNYETSTFTAWLKRWQEAWRRRLLLTKAMVANSSNYISNKWAQLQTIIHLCVGAHNILCDNKRTNASKLADEKYFFYLFEFIQLKLKFGEASGTPIGERIFVNVCVRVRIGWLSMWMPASHATDKCASLIHHYS